MIMNDEICVILNVNLNKLNGFFNSKTTKKIKKKKNGKADIPTLPM